MAAKMKSGRWTEEEVARLEELAEQNTPTRVMGIKLRRSEASIRSKASTAGISLKPANRGPYGTTTKAAAKNVRAAKRKIAARRKK